MSAFLDELCEVGPDKRVWCVDLFGAWSAWAKENGHKAGSSAKFGERLRAINAAISRHRAGPSDERKYFYEGIDLPNTG